MSIIVTLSVVTMWHFPNVRTSYSVELHQMLCKNVTLFIRARLVLGNRTSYTFLLSVKCPCSNEQEHKTQLCALFHFPLQVKVHFYQATLGKCIFSPLYSLNKLGTADENVESWWVHSFHFSEFYCIFLVAEEIYVTH